jgi:hypothetical protein
LDHDWDVYRGGLKAQAARLGVEHRLENDARSATAA